MATKQTFVVWGPYQTDAEMLSRRAAARTEHVAGLKRLGAEGFLKLGGPTSDPESGEAKGSMLIYEAESAAAVRGFLENDPYWAGNVWDKEKLEIRLVTLTVFPLQ
ncbi:hypothetical protein EDB84DRAFT_1005771 [Lactarius hengduanensis]|nr:hypothetical protein EDB84DRAFT_1005771 [Lactarius hengduanensis]